MNVQIIKFFIEESQNSDAKGARSVWELYLLAFRLFVKIFKIQCFQGLQRLCFPIVVSIFFKTESGLATNMLVGFSCDRVTTGDGKKVCKVILPFLI